MDASDKIRRDKSKAVWLNYKTAVLTPQGGSCPPACGKELNSGCAKVNYTSYEQKVVVSQGRTNCDCTTTCPCS